MKNLLRVRRLTLAATAALLAGAAFLIPRVATAHDRVTAGERPPAGFAEQKVRVNGVGINYVRGGHGPVLVLVHGYPETWYEWHEIMPALAERYTVIAPDLRGAGKSDAPAGGYDKKTVAEDLHALLVRLGLDRDIRLVGHDIGTMVSYAYAAAHPAEVRRLVLSEAPIPDDSLYAFPAQPRVGKGAWQFGFFALTNGLPEQTVAGREEQWVQGFTDQLEVVKDGVGPEDVRVFARYLKDPAHLRASFEWFRAFPTDVADNKVNQRRLLPMPVLAVGADHSLEKFLSTQVPQYATNVTPVEIANSGHWLYEEHPAEMTELLLDFLK